MSPAVLCLVAALLPAASGYLWAWMYSLPQHLPDEAALGRSGSPGDNLDEVSGGCHPPGVALLAGRGCSCSRGGSWVGSGGGN